MEIDDCICAGIERDLGLDIKYFRGQDIVPVRNCWHFCTDGRNVDVLFYDEEDFRHGMNLIPLLLLQFHVTILAFALMDTHVHFVLYGERQECDRFVHEYVRRISIHIARRHKEHHKLLTVKINCQKIADNNYLKNAICYTFRNPYVAGLHMTPYDYPWSSCPLMFRSGGGWTSPSWTHSENFRKTPMGVAERKTFFNTHVDPGGDWAIINGIVFPGEYVDYKTAERVFRTHRSFTYHLGLSKESEIESKGGEISSLSIPDHEMRQHRNEICLRLFGTGSVRGLSTAQRIRLAREMKRLFNSSPKQIIRLSGLVYDEAEGLI